MEAAYKRIGVGHSIEAEFRYKVGPCQRQASLRVGCEGETSWHVAGKQTCETHSAWAVGARRIRANRYRVYIVGVTPISSECNPTKAT